MVLSANLNLHAFCHFYLINSDCYWFQANILLSLFHFFCTVEKESETPLVYEAVSFSLEKGSSKGTTVGDYYLLLSSELFVWMMLFRLYFSSHSLKLQIDCWCVRKLVFSGFYGITLYTVLSVQYLNELFEMSIKVWCKLWLSSWVLQAGIS